MTEKKNEVVKYEPNQFMVLRDGDEKKIQRALSANIGNTKLDEFSLPKILTPGSGGTTWEINTIKGDQSFKELAGIIVHWEDSQSFWATDFDEEGGAPPDCSSKDGINGNGKPGGKCIECENNQWGSAKKGGGKACRIIRTLFILQPGAVLPIVYRVPPTGNKIIKDFFNNMASAAIPFYGAIVGFTLEKDKSKANREGKGGGIAYAKIKPHVIKELTDEETDKVEAYRSSLKMAGHGVEE